MAAWRKEEEGVIRNCQEKRGASETRKVAIVHGSVYRTCRARSIDLPS